MPTHVDLPAPVVVLRALAEPIRWRIVEALASEELCVCHLAEDLDVDQPLVSHHLRILRRAGLVEGERFRYWTYYRLAPGALAGVSAEVAGLAERTPAPATRRRPCC